MPHQLQQQQQHQELQVPTATVGEEKVYQQQYEQERLDESFRNDLNV